MKRAIGKGYAAFLVIHFWDLKLAPIDSALNSASGNLTNVGMVPSKPVKFENPG